MHEKNKHFTELAPIKADSVYKSQYPCVCCVHSAGTRNCVELSLLVKVNIGEIENLCFLRFKFWILHILHTILDNNL